MIMADLGKKLAFGLAACAVLGVPAVEGVQKGFDLLTEILNGAQGVAGEVSPNEAPESPTATTIPK